MFCQSILAREVEIKAIWWYNRSTEEKNMEKTKKKGKKLLTTLLCIIIGLAVAAGLIFAYYALFDGAASPEEAVSKYTKAALIYDVKDMIKYSSEYNKTVLYGNRETSDRLLKAYLEKAYEGRESEYKDNEISFELVSADRYDKDTKKFAEIKEKYDKKGDGDRIKEVCIVRMNVINGESKQTHNYIVVKIGLRWFYAYAQ